MLLENKSVIVTGGGRGIGAAICRVLASHGANVGVIYSKSKDKADAVVRSIEEKGGTAAAFRSDVCDRDAVATMVENVVDRFGRVDGLVNNAIAGTTSIAFEDADWGDYQGMLDFGCKAVFHTIRAVLPSMKRVGGGRIVNIVTELWNLAPAGKSTYVAGKGAMVGLSRSLAVELGQHNVTVNMIAPGWMITEKVDPESAGYSGFVQTLPLKRRGYAEEIGKGCVFFLSELADHVTGAYLPVTGGRVTQMGA